MASLSSSVGLSTTNSTTTTRLYGSSIRVPLPVPQSPLSSSSIHHSKSGVCKTSRAVELFPAVQPQIVVRDAQLGDYWGIADTHCSSFFPKYAFPLDVMLKVNRYVGLLSGVAAPPGCRRICLVAVTDSTVEESIYLEDDRPSFEALDGVFGFSRRSVAGILTLDNMGDFLPRKGPLRERRSRIAYISNVAVRVEQRRKGIAKMLVSEAVARAGSWGCRAVALHCDADDVAATNLYTSQGFRIIKVPVGANWPEPRSHPGTQFRFMMKLCPSRFGASNE